MNETMQLKFSMRNQFIELLKEICIERELTLSLFSGDWIAAIKSSTGTGSCIYGYNFSLNSSASAQICQDKNATSLILESTGIPTVRHELFLNPSDILVNVLIKGCGSVSRILDFASQCGYHVVLKPVCGTGGNGVMRATNCKEVEQAVLNLFQKYHALVVSPYLQIKREIRLVILNQQVRLVYEKKRPYVIGDGSSSISLLISKQLGSRGSSLGFPVDLDLARIPQKDEVVEVEWRHNLGHGATPVIITNPDKCFCGLAIGAANALNMRFCSVDVIETEAGEYLVLEVNSGVMMDSFISSPDSRSRDIAKSIYTDAIISSLECYKVS